MSEPRSTQYVSRGGDKLAAALDRFELDVSGRVCADFGSHVGGFVDCLLQHGAAIVHSVDTAYGTLAWKLRRDPRVHVLERTNAMHVSLDDPVEVVTIDVGWTRQSKILPNAARLLRTREPLPKSAAIEPVSFVVTLIKPHYEVQKDQLEKGVLPDELVDPVVRKVVDEARQSGWTVHATTESPIRGHGGNREVFAMLSRAGRGEEAT